MSNAVHDRKAAEAAFWRAHAARLDADLTALPTGSRTGAYQSEADRARALAEAIERELEETKPPTPLHRSSAAQVRCRKARICTYPNCDCLLAAAG